MIPSDKVKIYLETLAKQYPKQVIKRLDKGSKVQKSWGINYIIDDPNIYKKLGEFPKKTIPFKTIHEYLNESKKELLTIFNSDSEVLFSKVYEAKVGECLEKAILVHLFAQNLSGGFLINGFFSEEKNENIGLAHAYNILFKKGEPFLIDTQNPISTDIFGRVIQSYVAPIIGVEEPYGDFKVKKEWELGRKYSIF